MEWLNNYRKVSSWMSKYDLPKLLDDNDGLAKIPNFFPKPVAEALHTTLLKIPEARWKRTAASRDFHVNNIAHEFLSVKQDDSIAAVARALSLLSQDHYTTFSGAKYLNQHHIEPHDDRAYTDVCADNGQIIQCSREIAVIFYLTKDWTAADGGLLQDIHGGRDYVPEFNSCVAFRIPRMHAVTAVLGSRPRLSIFGWLLTPGQLYDLGPNVIQYQEESSEAAAAEPEQHMKRAHEDTEEDYEPLSATQRCVARLQLMQARLYRSKLRRLYGEDSEDSFE